jgi:hypothetical protein
MWGWLAKLFGYAAAPVAERVLSELNRETLDYLGQLEGESRPVPMPSAAIRHRDAQIASAAHAFPPHTGSAQASPPPCPGSLPPSAPPCPLAPPSEPPPPVSMSIDPPWHQASVRYESPPPTPRPMPLGRALGRTSSGPPPRMSPPPPLPPPPPRYERPGVPRPSRRKP